MAAEERYVTATGLRGLTRFYDSIVALTMREQLFRGRLARQVLTDLPPSARIADVGAGTGTFAIGLAAAAPGAEEVVGIDGDPQILAIAAAKAGAAAVEWKQGLANALPLADGSCDRVAMSLLLHHLDAAGKRAALAEAHRVLRPGGSLHIADWGRPQDPLMRAGLFTLAIFDGFDGIRDHAAGRLPRFVEEAGFVAVSRHDRLRTAWGSLELLSAGRPGVTESNLALVGSGRRMRSLPVALVATFLLLLSLPAVGGAAVASAPPAPSCAAGPARSGDEIVGTPCADRIVVPASVRVRRRRRR